MMPEIWGARAPASSIFGAGAYECGGGGVRSVKVALNLPLGKRNFLH